MVGIRRWDAVCTGQKKQNKGHKKIDAFLFIGKASIFLFHLLCQKGKAELDEHLGRKGGVAVTFFKQRL